MNNTVSESVNQLCNSEFCVMSYITMHHISGFTLGIGTNKDVGYVSLLHNAVES